jgi:hypothetical protein
MKAAPTRGLAVAAHQPPPIGAHWPGLPDYLYAGVMRGEQPGNDYHLEVLTGPAAAKFKGVWGDYGIAVAGAAHRRDGLANTQAMAEAGNKLAKKVLAIGAYIASQAEAQLVSANLYEQLPKGWHWTSTQYSPSNAWVQDFENGDSYLSRKDLEFRAVAVRRFFLQPFGPSEATGSANVGTAHEVAA